MRKQRFLAVLLSAALAFTPVINVMAEENAAQTEEGSSTGKTEESGEVDQTENQDIQETDEEGTGEIDSAEHSGTETKGQADAKSDNKEQGIGTVGGYIPSELDYDTPVYYGESRARRARSVKDTVPEKYPANGINDIKKKYPTARKQGLYGTCWAFSSIGLAEFDLINDGSFTKDNIDLSELQLAYFTYNFVTDPLGGTAGDVAKYYNENATRDFLQTGGNYQYSSKRMSQWIGTVNESLVPYENAEDVLENGLADKYAYDYDVAHLENTYLINISENTADVKKQIIEHGAVGAMYTHHTNGENRNDPNTYYDTKNTTVLANQDGGHAVMIVGWDDGFSKDNFTALSSSGYEKPAADGAWLIRNSWGDGYFDYFWMSYETYSLLETKTVWVMDFSANDGYDNNYQLDGGVMTQTYPYYPTVANVFNVSPKEGVSSEELKAVSLSLTHATSVGYTIKVYTDLKDSTNPLSGTLQESATTEGRTTYAGMYTIPLKNTVKLEPGTSYAVVVTLDQKVMDMEYAYLVQNGDKLVWDNRISKTDNGSYYYNGSNFSPYPQNFCIKAFTSNNSKFGEKITGTSATLNGSIDMNLYVDIPADSELMNNHDAYIEFTVNGNTSKVKVRDAEATKYGKKFTCPVVAKEMTSEIQVQFVSEGERSQVYTYTVKDYAEKILNDSKGLYSDKAKNLVKAMLNYGANAQTYFGYNTENLANANLSDDDKNASLGKCDFTGYKPIWTPDQTVTGIKYYGSSLNLNTNTNVKNYFELEGGHTIDEYTFSYTTNGITCEVTPVQKTMGDKEVYLVEIPDIKSYLLNEDIVVTIKSKAQPESIGIKMSYSPFSYCYAASVLRSEKEPLINLTKSLYWYWYNADQYMKSTNS